ncbi:hypothetical protein OSH11_11935 [Kaistia dalseonensis]|uniref:Uncharacterized protein n=1 Tax=Kaistia dalseonensis TaxID=410840 RepID=A0ABU0H6S8_9HYPH|nr:hypothetical protein [Kaistia dalseonensis]MCX5495419.1 hypothetical protein [Kaistia dalseonensis]MDQ0438009.1 hypothetical protein [Kaistia dalseonensis]
MNAHASIARAIGETTLTEVIDRLRHGTIYEDYDWLAGLAGPLFREAAE